ncbi:MAG: glycosyltransferase family 2 protein [Candidatus Korobacteraceae bacterium]
MRVAMISLIVATVDRVAELERLLASLEAQTYKDFEVLVIDQNGDERLAPVLGRHQGLRMQHLRCERGVSRARNVGLRLAQGSIVAIPDDDCWYPENLLASVAEWFQSHPDFGALFATMRSAEGKPIGPKWPKGPCQCTKKNAMACVTAINGFLRRTVTDAIGFFNENIGPGVASQYAAGEDMEYFLRPFGRGVQMWYEPSIWVGHPDLHSLERLRRTSYTYALGAGYVMRVHGYSWGYLSQQIARSLAGAAVTLCQGDVKTAQSYAMRAAGQLHGYCFGPGELARIAKSRTG